MSPIRKTSQCSVYKYPPTNSVHLMFHALKPIVKFKFRGLLGSMENARIRVELLARGRTDLVLDLIFSINDRFRFH